jgi:hypothetical protein
LKSLQSLAVLCQLLRQEPQGHWATELCVLGLVHDTHAAATEFFQDAIVRDGLADHGKEALLGGHLRPRQQVNQWGNFSRQDF